MVPISILRRKVFSRRPRSIMSLRRSFMLYKVDKNNQICFKEFDKFINEYKLDISNGDKKKIFKSFDKNNSKTIDHDELVEGLIGSVNLLRAKMVEKVFEKLDEAKKRKN